MFCTFKGRERPFLATLCAHDNFLLCRFGGFGRITTPLVAEAELRPLLRNAKVLNLN
jgi:hypothetical protein